MAIFENIEPKPKDKEDEALALDAEKFINLKIESPSEALRAWGGGVDIILATPPAAVPMIAAFPGLALNGTMVVLGAPPDNLAVSPMDLIMGRRRLMGSPAGSRKDLRDTLHLARYARSASQSDAHAVGRRREGAEKDASGNYPWACCPGDGLKRLHLLDSRKRAQARDLVQRQPFFKWSGLDNRYHQSGLLSWAKHATCSSEHFTAKLWLSPLT